MTFPFYVAYAYIRMVKITRIGNVGLTLRAGTPLPPSRPFLNIAYCGTCGKGFLESRLVVYV